MFKLSVLCLAVIAVSASASDEDRIVGGHKAKPGQFPFFVSIRREDPYINSHICGGAILNERAVLTTANCTGTSSFTYIRRKIAVGANHRSLDGEGVLHSIRKVFIHPHYDADKMDNNIAVVQPKVKITFSRLVGPIKLPSTDTPNENNVALTVIGWGQYRVGISMSVPKIH